MRIKTWQALVTGLAAGLFCSLVWTLVLHLSCDPVFHLLPWLCWPIVALVTGAALAGLILHRRRRADRSGPAPRFVPRSGAQA